MQPINQPLGIDQCNCFALRKAARRITRFYDAHLEPSRLRITQFLTLAALNELGSAAVGALAVFGGGVDHGEERTEQFAVGDF